MFCGATEGRSKEHVLRRKWRTLLDETEPVPLKVDHTYSDGRRPHTDSWVGKRYEAQVRDVCRECNSGWMERLETEVEDLVLRLATGWKGVVTADERAALGRWLAKTNFVQERLDRSANSSTLIQRQAVMRNEVVPWFAWLLSPLQPHDEGFRTRSTPILARHASRVPTPFGPVDASFRWRVSTVVIRQVHFLSVYAPNPAAWAYALSQGRGAVLKHWDEENPPGPITWPSPSQRLPPESVNGLHEAVSAATVIRLDRNQRPR